MTYYDAMKRFIRDNLMIVSSIALPVFVVVFFALATIVPRYVADPPMHNLVLAMETSAPGSTSPQVRVTLDVIEGRLRARAERIEQNQRGSVPRIFEYVAADATIREIAISLPDDIAASEQGSEIPIPEFFDRRLSTTLTAPDGYAFEQFRSGGGGLFRDFFGGGRRQMAPRLRKGSAVIDIDIPSAEPYYYYSLRFIGWVVQ